MSEEPVGFDLTGQETPSPSDNDGVDQFLTENVGEGKKYSSTEEALAALVKKTQHQDTFIETLKLEKQGVEQEKNQMETKLQEAKTVQDLMEALSEGDSTPPVQDQGSEESADSAHVPVEELSKIVKDLLKAEEDAKVAQTQKEQLRQNIDKAFSTLTKSEDEGGFGSEAAAKEAMRRYVGESQERKELIDRMGAYQPDSVAGFLKMQLKNESKMEGLGSSDLNPGETPQGNGMLTWKQVQTIKKENPKLYKSREFQMRVHDAADKNPTFWN